MNIKISVEISGEAIYVGSNIDKGPVVDMACLCEAICTLIHSAESAGIKKSSASLRDCIHHLEQGVMDASYRATMEKV